MINMRKSFFLCLLLGVTLVSCNNVEKKAQPILQAAQAAYEKGELDEARMLIDTIKVLYPKAFETRKAGQRLQLDVEETRQQRLIATLDSIIAAKNGEVDVLKPKFKFEKDAEYQQIGNYLAPSQVLERNLHRSYLRFQTDELGKMSMTSIYCGKGNIHHTSVCVPAPDKTYAETPMAKDSYETTDMGEHIEKADYKLGDDGDVISFVAMNVGKSLRVEFRGDKKYTTQLTKADVKAAHDVLELSQLLGAITVAKQQREEAQLRLDFIREKKARKEQD